MDEYLTREDFLKRAGQITLGAIATGGLVVAPSMAEVEWAKAEATRVTQNGKRIMREARKWLGTPYKHNGRSRHGIDCSMFVKRVYGASLGVYVPDDPVAIWRNGARRRGEVCVGDILCYKENHNYISHVAIQCYGGDVIHASAYWGKVVKAPRTWRGCNLQGAAVWR